MHWRWPSYALGVSGVTLGQVIPPMGLNPLTCSGWGEGRGLAAESPVDSGPQWELKSLGQAEQQIIHFLFSSWNEVAGPASPPPHPVCGSLISSHAAPSPPLDEELVSGGHPSKVPQAQNPSHQAHSSLL